MNEKLGAVLEGLVDSAILQQGFEGELLDVPLGNLGVDSLASMVILDRLEDDFGVEIDYDSFSLRDIATARHIAALLEEQR